jgi:hypothetical protein
LSKNKGLVADGWSPNEDFGTSKHPLVRAFVSTFHTPKYSIWAKSDENFMLPKRRFWKIEQSVAYAFLKYFSRGRVLVLGFQ